MNRRELRIRIMKTLYAHAQTSADITHLQKTMLKDIPESTKEYLYAVKMLQMIIQQPDEVNENIKQFTANWDMQRINMIDLVLLRMGIAELFYFPDIPPKVTINEMIDISKEYSSEKSGQFINGILDSIHLDGKKSGKINKTGRGLKDN